MWIYRGQTDGGLPLLPKAGRPQFDDPQARQRRANPAYLQLPPDDVNWFSWLWKKEAVAFSQEVPQNEFECLAYAQHYGLATRLLDWTTNPLAALYFAVEAEYEKDGGVFAYTSTVHIDSDKGILDQPAHPVALYFPRPFDRRILCQAACFTCHSEPWKPLPLEPDGAVRIIVPSARKHEIQKWLDTIGVNRKTLFPDLEGLSAFINWRVTCRGDQ